MQNQNIQYCSPTIELQPLTQVDVLSVSNDGEWDIN